MERLNGVRHIRKSGSELAVGKSLLYNILIADNGMSNNGKRGSAIDSHSAVDFDKDVIRRQSPDSPGDPAAMRQTIWDLSQIDSHHNEGDYPTYKIQQDLGTGLSGQIG